MGTFKEAAAEQHVLLSMRKEQSLCDLGIAKAIMESGDNEPNPTAVINRLSASRLITNTLPNSESRSSHYRLTAYGESKAREEAEKAGRMLMLLTDNTPVNNKEFDPLTSALNELVHTGFAKAQGAPTSGNNFVLLSVATEQGKARAAVLKSYGIKAALTQEVPARQPSRLRADAASYG